MQIKLFEVRDRSTFMPCMVIKLGFKGEAEAWLLRRAGYGPDYRIFDEAREGFFLFHPLETNRIEWDYCAWEGRTLPTVHGYVKSNWDTLQSGDILDVEFILGETSVKKETERGHDGEGPHA